MGVPEWVDFLCSLDLHAENVEEIKIGSAQVADVVRDLPVTWYPGPAVGITELRLMNIHMQYDPALEPAAFEVVLAKRPS